MANIALTRLEMVLRGEPTPRFEFYKGASSRIRKCANLGKPRRLTLIYLIIGGMQTGGTSPGGKDQDGHGMMKSEGFKLRISHPRCGIYCVCDGECTHTPCRTHIFSDTVSFA